MDDTTRSMQGGVAPRPTQPLLSWGPFHLLEKVGQGASGEVYRAWDPALQRDVALKLLLPRGSDREDEARTVLREARLAARVRHPNVVAIYGVDHHDGRVGFWSDFIRGKTLSAVLAAQGPFGYREAALIGIEICKAVSAVHAAGLLHRDIKAGNGMREEGGRILLMDFGLTHEYGSSERLVGTPSYMAPELFEGYAASPASDIYAVGVLLFHLVTAKYPVAGATVNEVRAAHESGSHRSLLDERADLPERFVHVIETSLNRDPNKRYATAGQVLSALAEANGMGSTSMEAAPKMSTRQVRRLQILIPVAVLALFGIIWFALIRNSTWLKNKDVVSAKPAAEADFLNAQGLLDHYYRPHSLENAIALFQRSVQEDPKFAPAYASICRAEWYQYRSTGNTAFIEPARMACNQALELDGDSASAHVTLVMIYTQTGKTDLAADELHHAFRLDSRNADAYGASGELYAKQGRDAEVEPALQKAVDLDPGSWRWLNQLGLYYQSVGKFQAASKEFQQAVTLFPDNARAYNNLGIAYRQQNRLAEAVTAYRKSIEIDPSFNVLSNLGAVLELEGNYAEAAQMYRRSIEVNASNYLAWGNLASACLHIPEQKAEGRKSYVKAISLAEEARKQRPNDATLISFLGYYYSEIGTENKSLPLLRQALALAPDDPQVMYRVAQGYEVLHHRAEALQWIENAFARGLPVETVRQNSELAPLVADPRFSQAAHARVR